MNTKYIDLIEQTFDFPQEEFKIENNILKQTATFRPRGLAGRLYWYSVLPFHGFIFKGMIKNLVKPI